MKEIPGYKGYYVTPKGDIYSSKGSKLKPYINEHYLHIVLSVQGERKGLLVHRAVALAFIPNPENYGFINHIDGNKSNNSISNLEWCTHKQNMQHAFRTKLADNSGSKNGMAKTVLNTATGIFYDTIKEAADATGRYTSTAVSLMLTGKSSNRSNIIYA